MPARPMLARSRRAVFTQTLRAMMGTDAPSTAASPQRAVSMTQRVAMTGMHVRPMHVMATVCATTQRLRATTATLARRTRAQRRLDARMCQQTVTTIMRARPTAATIPRDALT
jgi:hypothetical protein